MQFVLQQEVNHKLVRLVTKTSDVISKKEGNRNHIQQNKFMVDLRIDVAEMKNNRAQ